MKILSTQIVKGRGIVTCVETPKSPIKAGTLVWQGDKCWKVMAVEHGSPSTVGLVLLPRGGDFTTPSKDRSLDL